ncbi:MAG TPA: glycosyltransferase family 1 protein [Gemmatimonadales bacterium]|nr:glycosyltransferase family 1 protein [Gemmatimonadales bacterium]
MIGLDAVRALRNGTGLGNHARGVLRGLREAAPDLALVLYSPRPARPAWAGLPTALAAPLRLPPPAWRGPGLRALWRTFRLGRAARRDGVTLYHGLTHEIPRDLPATGIPSVVTFHDLLFLTHPEFFPAIDRASYAWRYRWSAAHASAVVAVSAATRDALVERLGVAADRIAVIPPARDERFAAPVPAEALAAVRARHDLPSEYVVAVGTLEPRKNQALAVEAVARLGAGAPPLVLVGRDGGSAATLRALAHARGVAARVLLRSDVSDADLPAVVAGARASCYLSVAEGFGMPIVEALGAGVPVVAAAVDCLREAGGPGTRYVPPDDADALAAALGEVLGDTALAGRMREQGRRHAARFDRVTLARRHLALYDAVRSGGRLPPEAPGD